MIVLSLSVPRVTFCINAPVLTKWGLSDQWDHFASKRPLGPNAILLYKELATGHP